MRHKQSFHEMIFWLLFEIFRRRHERGLTIVTSNLPFRGMDQRDPPMRPPQPIQKPAKSPPLRERRVRRGYETPAMSAGAEPARSVMPSPKLAWSSSGPLAGFCYGVDRFPLLDCCHRRQALHIPISGPVVEIDILSRIRRMTRRFVAPDTRFMYCFQ
jgi:hypothetical protein